MFNSFSYICSFPGLNDSMSSTSSSSAKLVHEQLALQWSIASGSCRDAALAAGWFFLELTSKAMVEHLATTSRLTTPRKARFSDQFHDDVLNLVAKLTSDIVCRHRESPEVNLSCCNLTTATIFTQSMTSNR